MRHYPERFVQLLGYVTGRLLHEPGGMWKLPDSIPCRIMADER